MFTLFVARSIDDFLKGHEIVATIAQIHLHPTAADRLCSVLPEYAKCHLAPVASWADKIRMRMRWSGALHYVNGIGDHPSQKCVFGEEGWVGTKGQHVLGGVRNTTMWLKNGNDGAEEALKFLVHFVGDMHQPLHLTGRDKGGNGAKVRFDGRVTSEPLAMFTPLLISSVNLLIRPRPPLCLGQLSHSEVTAYDTKKVHSTRSCTRDRECSTWDDL